MIMKLLFWNNKSTDLGICFFSVCKVACRIVIRKSSE